MLGICRARTPPRPATRDTCPASQLASKTGGQNARVEGNATNYYARCFLFALMSVTAGSPRFGGIQHPRISELAKGQGRRRARPLGGCESSDSAELSGRHDHEVSERPTQADVGWTGGQASEPGAYAGSVGG